MVWQAAVPVALAGLDLVMQGVRKGDQDDEIERQRREALANAEADMYLGFAKRLGGRVPQTHLAAQRAQNDINSAARTAKEGNEINLQTMLGALASAGTTIGSELSGGAPSHDSRGNSITEDDADYDDFQRAGGGPRSGRMRMWEF